MARSRFYLDHNATTPLRPEARLALLEALDTCGNASSVHREGRAARARLETARAAVAGLFGASPDRVWFGSGGTEAANLVSTPRFFSGGRETTFRLCVGATEHAAVLQGHRFATATIVPVDAAGRIDLSALAAAIAEGGPALLALQAANNETGVLQPLAEAAALVHARGGMLLCDAVQAVGRIAYDDAAPPADFVFLSGHKIGGGFGAGALVGLGAEAMPDPLLRGGGQERGMRAGSENVAAVAAFGVAATMVRAAPDAERLRLLRDAFEAELLNLAPETVIFGRDVPRLPNTCAFAVPGLSAETLTMALDLAGVAVSSGSACSSGKVGRSHVLEAMGVRPDLRRGAIRVSLGWTSDKTDIDAALEALRVALKRMVRRIAA